MKELFLLIVVLAAVGLWTYIILDDLFDFSEPLSEEEKRKIIQHHK